MPHRSNTPSPSADLDRVAELFAQWQATRTFAPTPHELRKQAVALLRTASARARRPHAGGGCQ